jgi:hypothetical protein
VAFDEHGRSGLLVIYQYSKKAQRKSDLKCLRKASELTSLLSRFPWACLLRELCDCRGRESVLGTTLYGISFPACWQSCVGDEAVQGSVCPAALNRHPRRYQPVTSHHHGLLLVVRTHYGVKEICGSMAVAALCGFSFSRQAGGDSSLDTRGTGLCARYL